MKKLLFILCFALSFSSAFSQWLKPNSSYGVIFNRTESDSVFLYPTGCGTPPMLSTADKKRKMSAMYFDSCNAAVYVFNPKDSSWAQWSGSGASSDTPVVTRMIWPLRADSLSRFFRQAYVAPSSVDSFLAAFDNQTRKVADGGVFLDTATRQVSVMDNIIFYIKGLRDTINTPIVYTIPAAATGKYRTDLIYIKLDGTADTAQGLEGDDVNAFVALPDSGAFALAYATTFEDSVISVADIPTYQNDAIVFVRNRKPFTDSTDLAYIAGNIYAGRNAGIGTTNGLIFNNGRASQFARFNGWWYNVGAGTGPGNPVDLSKYYLWSNRGNPLMQLTTQYLRLIDTTKLRADYLRNTNGDSLLRVNPSTGMFENIAVADVPGIGGGGTTLYSGNGTISSNRTINADNKTLTFNNVPSFSSFNLNESGTVAQYGFDDRSFLSTFNDGEVASNFSVGRNVQAQIGSVTTTDSASALKVDTTKITLQTFALGIPLPSKGNGKVLTSDANGNATWQTPSGGGISALTGDVTASGTGSVAATLATVNSNVGSFGSATQSPAITVNGKGLITAVSNTTITPAVGSITGLGTGVATWLATASSANLRAALPDESGNGAALFQNGDLGAATGTSLALGSTLGSSAILDLTSTTKAFYKPRMTTAQMDAISSPAAGAEIYNTDEGSTFTYSTDWGWESDNHKWRTKFGTEYFNDFLGINSTATGSLSDGNLTTFASGGVAASLVTPPTNRQGIIELSTSTSATGRAAVGTSIGTTAQSMILGGGRLLYEVAVMIPTLSTSGERYQLLAGLTSSNSGVNISNGVMFLYDEGGVTTSSAASANWQVYTAAASSRTFTTTSVAVTAGQWYRLAAVVNAAGTSVGFYIDGTLVRTETATIPTAAIGISNQIFKSVGTTARTAQIDYIYFKQKYTTPK